MIRRVFLASLVRFVVGARVVVVVIGSWVVPRCGAWCWSELVWSVPIAYVVADACDADQFVVVLVAATVSSVY
jgi:hypothetical protein